MEAPEIHTHTDNLRAAIDSLLYGYAKRFPQECDRFIKAAENVRKQQYNEKAISEGGKFLLKAQFPPRVFYAMQGCFPDFMDDQVMMALFMEQANKFCINMTSIPKVNPNCEKRVV